MKLKITPALMLAADILALGLAFGGGYVLGEVLSEALVNRPLMSGNVDEMQAWIWLYSAQLVTMVVLFMSRGHYLQKSPWWEQVKYVSVVTACMLTLAGCMLFALKLPFSRLWVGSCFVLVVPLVVITRLLARRLALMLGQWGVDVAIVGGPENVMETVFALNSDSYNAYRVREIYLLGTNATMDVDSLPKPQQGAKQVAVRIDQLPALVKKSRLGMFIAAPDEATRLDMPGFMAMVMDLNKRVAFVPPMTGMSLYGMEVQHFFGSHTVLLKPKRRVERQMNRVFKRVLDLVGASFGFALLGIPMLVVAHMIRRDGGPALYYQMRVGMHGKPFRCWKLRSMIPDAKEVLEKLLANDPQARAEFEKDFKLKNDPRITRIGNIIRKTSIDELPQLWNVLRGDMSLVGPRPIVTKELEYYGKNQADYLAAKPGLTGLWQVSGRNDTSYAYRVYLDSWYVAHWSLWTDIVIIVQTVGILLNRKGAY